MADESTKENEKKSAETDSAISSELIRGHINTIILRTLYDGDKYGYEIINEIEDKSKGQYTLKQPTLYSALKRLEQQDFVTSYWGGVSNGGRRKYFQITEKGRKVVEQNRAEWEYSRTIIDSLISERDYDFNNPPPAGNVDFSLLRKSTTRVPAGRGESEDEFAYGNEEAQPFPSPADQAYRAEGAEENTDEYSAEEQEPQAYSAEEAVTEEDKASAAAQYTEEQTERSDTFEEDTSATEEDVYAEEPPHVLSPEEQQRIHENYRALIGENGESAYYEQIRRNEEETQQTENAQNLADSYSRTEQTTYDEQYEHNRAVSSELLYANRPPEERNYKELIARLYENTRQEEPTYEQAPVYQQPVYEESPAPAPDPAPVARHNAAAPRDIEFYDVQEQAENDGLRVTTATGRRNRIIGTQNSPAAGSVFDKGRLLFVTALWVFVIALVESVINACLIHVLNLNAAYVALPFVFSVIMLAIFFVMFMRGYGKNSKKVKTRSYVSATLIIYVNVLLIICLIAFLVTGFSGTITLRNVLVYAVFPCIFLFNIPLFAIIYYYLFSKE